MFAAMAVRASRIPLEISAILYRAIAVQRVFVGATANRQAFEAQLTSRI